MPLVVWLSPGMKQAQLTERDGCTTKMQSYESRINIGEGFPYLLLWIWCRVSEPDFLLPTVSPTYALLIPFVALSTKFSYRYWYSENLIVKSVESSWDPSARQGKLSIYDLLGFVSALYTYTELAHNGHLNIRDERIILGSIIPPRLLPQFLL